MTILISEDKKRLIKTCNLIERGKLKPNELYNNYDLMFEDFDKHETDLSLSESLSCFKIETLWLIFPHCYSARKAVLIALNAADLIPFHEAIAKIARVSPYKDISAYCFENNWSTCDQVFNQKNFSKVAECVSITLINDYLKALNSSQLGYQNLVTMVEAYLGLNQDKIKLLLVKFNQPAIKAYGLLPIDTSEKVVQRYLKLGRINKECLDFGVDRRANVRAAVKVGLKNLSNRAGFKTLKELENALSEVIKQEEKRYFEANPADISDALFKSNSVGKWNVKIILSGIKPVLRVSIKNTCLKEVPVELIQMSEYQIYMDALKYLDKLALCLKHMKPRVKHVSFYEFENSEDVEGQVVDQMLLRKALQGVPESLVKAYLLTLKGTEKYHDLVLIVEAFSGLNRERLKKGIVRHGQVALKAYGLLPIESKKELLQRYQTFKKSWKTATQYGAERQANTRAAVQIGLENLATRAGYSDATRLEWDLEGEISSGAQTLFKVNTVGQWEVKLAIEGIKPILQVSKQGKKLKSIPVGLRKTKEYSQYREAMNQLKEQARRFRFSLEDMMINKEIITRAELKKLLKMPVMQGLLANLLGVNEKNEIGFIDPESLMLMNGNSQFEIKQTLRIAHTHDLFAHLVLSDWQRQIVKNQIVQPFKQAFRELYLLTPAEIDTGNHTNRFSQRSVNGAVAYRLLQSRGWSQGEKIATKLWSYHKVEAHWEFPDIQYFMAGSEKIISSKISFFSSGEHQSEAVLLKDVCPIIFSETLRDADLVVSVGKHGKLNNYWSNEIQVHRTSVTKYVAENLGVSDLRFDGKYVFVKGKWGEYKIHLGTANVYLGSRHLCIGPAIDKPKKVVYLPFADADIITSEIIAKILLLKNDVRIKDKTILGQIKR